jgi:hypothetical protein
MLAFLPLQLVCRVRREFVPMLRSFKPKGLTVFILGCISQSSAGFGFYTGLQEQYDCFF